VIRWRFAPRFAELEITEVSFLPFLRHAFAQKRKTLANNLRAAGIQHAAVASALRRAGAEPQARAEALSIETLAAISKSLQNDSGATG
jgi:16S rRNA (adenine1518-N6/adenine1519-N6)-dimethyltransferase